MKQAVRAISYRRVSTDEQAESGLGLEAQSVAIHAEMTRRGWVLVQELSDEGVGAGSLKRPSLTEAIDLIESGSADTLVVARLDRLTRSVGDLSELVQRALANSWSLVILDTDVDMTTAGGRLIANLMGSVAQWEREIIGERTRAALLALKASGRRLGRPVEHSKEARQRIVREFEAGRSLRAIAKDLNEEEVPTPRGGRWHASTIKRILDSVSLDAEMSEIRACETGSSPCLRPANSFVKVMV